MLISSWWVGISIIRLLTRNIIVFDRINRVKFDRIYCITEGILTPRLIDLRCNNIHSLIDIRRIIIIKHYVYL